MTPGSGQPTPLPSPSHGDSQLNSTLCLCDHAFEPYAGALQSLKHREWSSLGEIGPIGCRGSVRPSGCMQPTEVVLFSASASQRFAALHLFTQDTSHRYASHRLACALVGPRVRSGLSSANALDFSSSQNVTPVVLFCSKTSGTMNV